MTSSSLDPLHWKIQENGFIFVKSYPAVIGEEAAGNMETVRLKGIRPNIASKFTSFQQYCIIIADSTAKIPDNMTFDQAASVQLVKLFGFSPIITTASFHNTGLLSSRSATRVLDRNLSTIASKKTQLLRSRQLLALRHLTPALFLTHETAHDTITAGGTVIAVGVPQVDDRNEDKVVQQVFGSFHPTYWELGKSFTPAVAIKLNAIEVVPDDLDGVPDLQGLEIK
ncbi:uncharacterized protein F5891DRAFT_1173061 [Suillus fuscotomentosus]|uniref:Uncharacterized protein n=1 Tax=Suillus fuscotomentosus TaxID=1912939 RepID=A0AAD4HLJ2_9AGAM|nr:uncharacterized protein F5891DRAFT_1173061 [Suillus fuscotomentosus]KAG1900611.1 hypothetical protein F5891DRAFT_1173061 [Suillus fuscotomentosus]